MVVFFEGTLSRGSEEHQQGSDHFLKGGVERIHPIGAKSEIVGEKAGGKRREGPKDGLKKVSLCFIEGLARACLGSLPQPPPSLPGPQVP